MIRSLRWATFAAALWSAGSACASFAQPPGAAFPHGKREWTRSLDAPAPPSAENALVPPSREVAR